MNKQPISTYPRLFLESRVISLLCTFFKSINLITNDYTKNLVCTNGFVAYLSYLINPILVKYFVKKPENSDLVLIWKKIKVTGSLSFYGQNRTPIKYVIKMEHKPFIYLP